MVKELKLNHRTKLASKASDVDRCQSFLASSVTSADCSSVPGEMLGFRGWGGNAEALQVIKYQ